MKASLQRILVWTVTGLPLAAAAAVPLLAWALVETVATPARAIGCGFHLALLGWAGLLAWRQKARPAVLFTLAWSVGVALAITSMMLIMAWAYPFGRSWMGMPLWGGAGAVTAAAVAWMHYRLSP